MEDEQEFEVGEIITYKPFERGLKAKVIGIQIGRGSISKKDDDSVFYILTGRGKKKSEAVNAKTMGYSIMESVLYGKDVGN